MAIFYIVDTTQLNELHQNPVVTFKHRDSVVKYLEGMCGRQFKMTRPQYMQHQADLGVGEDDEYGRAFYEAMTEYFNIGIIRSDKPIKCNIFDATLYSKDQGD